MTASDAPAGSPLHSVAQLLDRPGPFTSVYLAAESDVPDAAHRLETRWGNARRELADKGADEALLDRIGEAINSDEHGFGGTVVVLADKDDVQAVHHLPKVPPTDVYAVRRPIPHVMPLLRQEQYNVPVIAVATDRVGAEVVLLMPHVDDVHTDVKGDDLHVQRSSPGGWSQRRFQQRAENAWESNAGEVADQLATMVDRYRPRAVVVSGDVRAVQFLREKAASRVADLIQEVQGEYHSADDVVEQAQEVAMRIATGDIEAALEDLEREHGQGDRVAAGVDDVLAAVSRGQVDTLLLTDDDELLNRPVWVGPEPGHVGSSRDVLAALGVDDPQEAPLGDAAARAALASGGRVLLVRPELAEMRAEAGLTAGVAATLRWTQ